MTKLTKASICIGLSGLVIGWLAGLSLSPVIEVVLTSLISLLASSAALLVGMQKFGENELPEGKGIKSALPVFLLILGIGIGAPVGVIARTNMWFGRTVENRISAFTDLGIPRDTALKYLKQYEIDQLKAVPAPPKKAEAGKKDEPAARTPNDAGIYATRTDLCNLLKQNHGEALRTIMVNFGDADTKAKALKCTDSLALEKLKTQICP
ncbi:hypothetical protein [Mucilaginibacter sp.]|uniref:hypothetical protein n=1 Tax=Mucilaginibacter sp. TaxID=1882438 RepID=UPI003D0BE4F7